MHAAAQVLAERAAWDYAKKEKLDLVVINPVSGTVAAVPQMCAKFLYQCQPWLILPQCLWSAGLRARPNTVRDGNSGGRADLRGKIVSCQKGSGNSSFQLNQHGKDTTEGACDQMQRHNGATHAHASVILPTRWVALLRYSTALQALLSNMESMFSSPDLQLPSCDVRDVARAHILAAEIPTASGRCAWQNDWRHAWHIRLPHGPLRMYCTFDMLTIAWQMRLTGDVQRKKD